MTGRAWISCSLFMSAVVPAWGSSLQGMGRILITHDPGLVPEP